MKCIPITLPGFLVTDAISVIDIDDVFEARIALSLQNSLNCLNKVNLISWFSVAASITRSALDTANFRSVNVVILLRLLF